ncbi:MAG: twin-arginine translocase TatA/TatE family subunit [Flavobacteriia bacterium]|jgi:sec-independent protein translocase protein TatA|nr:twin-arginine translocase TatA/TatE family subunit [Flavobacteriia bacterium]
MSATILMGMIGGPQIILIVVAILLLFGGRKIPELMRGLGGGIKEFKDAVKEDEPKESSKDDPKDNKS